VKSFKREQIQHQRNGGRSALTERLVEKHVILISNVGRERGPNPTNKKEKKNEKWPLEGRCQTCPLTKKSNGEWRAKMIRGGGGNRIT